jgi:hypothetical protein
MAVMHAAVLEARAGDVRGAENRLRRAGELLEGLNADQLRSNAWLPDQLAAQRELLRAWELGPTQLGEAFLLPMRRLLESVGPHSGSMFSVVLSDLRALRARRGSLPAEVEAFLATVFPASS